MQVIRDLADFPFLINAVVTSGTFDGVHRGHQRILARLRQVADAVGGPAVVITYWPHPRLVRTRIGEYRLADAWTVAEVQALRPPRPDQPDRPTAAPGPEAPTQPARERPRRERIKVARVGLDYYASQQAEQAKQSPQA